MYIYILSCGCKDNNEHMKMAIVNFGCFFKS